MAFWSRLQNHQGVLGSHQARYMARQTWMGSRGAHILQWWGGSLPGVVSACAVAWQRANALGMMLNNMLPSQSLTIMLSVIIETSFRPASSFFWDKSSLLLSVKEKLVWQKLLENYVPL